MVNHNNDIHQDDVEITTDNEHRGFTDPDIEEVEENQKGIISSLKEKLKNSEAEKRSALEELQRAKADFLNARKRLEDERLRDRQRIVISHVEELIPLCDSFEMAMSDKVVWEKADAMWRKGIEGISAQLDRLLGDYKVTKVNPIGQTFNPRQHEALSMTPVEEQSAHDTITKVVQSGYEITHTDGTTELIRPARVIIGVFEEK
jgi:molecular chaperone GrpE